MGEVPDVVRVYDEFHPQGLDIVGVSLDKSSDLDHIREVLQTNRMTWPQICDGQQWTSPLVLKCAINGIPSMFLVDGDTGNVLAAPRELRSDQLRATVERVMHSRPVPNR